MTTDAHQGAPAPEQLVTILLAEGPEQRQLSVVEHTLRPFSLGPASHSHAARLVVCYVIEGLLALGLRDETLVLNAGELQVVPAGAPHTYWNPTAAQTRILLIFTPGAAQDDLRRVALGESVSASGPWDTS